MLALPNQSPGALARFGLTRAQADRSAWAIEPGGRKLAGAAAINRVLAEIGGFWGAVSRAYRLPPIRWLEDQLYGWVARHRPWLSAVYGATPACEEPGALCE